MVVKLSEAVRNAQLDAYETAMGTSPKIRIYSGSAPATLAAAPTGTLLVEIEAPADWLAAAAAGQKVKQGTWQADAVGAGNAGYYRIVNSAGSATHEQGTVTATGGGGDMTINNVSIAIGQTVVISTFSKTAGNA